MPHIVHGTETAWALRLAGADPPLLQVEGVVPPASGEGREKPSHHDDTTTAVSAGAASLFCHPIC